jgi:ubiquinone/menaquinone biosynthesis C-methylase UbiE
MTRAPNGIRPRSAGRPGFGRPQPPGRAEAGRASPSSAIAAATASERKKTQRLFQRVAFSFHAIDRMTMPGYRSVLAYLDLPASFRALDVATGSGAFAKALSDRGHEVTGLDFSPRLLARAQKRVPGATFLLRDLVELPAFAADSFELVTMSQLLHGLSDELRAFTLEQAARIASAHVLIFDYTALGPWHVRLIEWIEGPYYRHYLRRPFAAQLADAGLEVERTYSFGYVGYWLCKPAAR